MKAKVNESKGIVIKEFDWIREKIPTEENNNELPTKAFNALENFVLASNNEFLTLSVRKNIGKVISAKNYVGIITLKDGTVIEILPKIANIVNDNYATRKIFIEMLKTLKDTPFKEFNHSNLNTEKLSLFEIFIKMFLDEAITLSKQGLKSAYVETEENEKYYKGKLLVSQNIRYNISNKARFFVCYDDFSVNRPENKLIKTTLKYLHSLTREQSNQRKIISLLSEFDRVDYSTDHDTDFSKATLDRTMKRYTNLINWCRVFLKGNSFSAYAGSEIAIALLFPMEKIFESYVAALFRKHTLDFSISTQDNLLSLFDSPNKAFYLKPDILLKNKDDKREIVLDTKWKLLSENKENYGISQSDMYQMYAYGKKYTANQVILLYPTAEMPIKTKSYSSVKENFTVDVRFIDLSSICFKKQDAVDKAINNIFA